MTDKTFIEKQLDIVRKNTNIFVIFLFVIIIFIASYLFLWGTNINLRFQHHGRYFDVDKVIFIMMIIFILLVLVDVVKKIKGDSAFLKIRTNHAPQQYVIQAVNQEASNPKDITMISFDNIILLPTYLIMRFSKVEVFLKSEVKEISAEVDKNLKSMVNYIITTDAEKHTFITAEVTIDQAREFIAIIKKSITKEMF